MSGSGMSQRGRLPQLEPVVLRTLQMRLRSSRRSPRMDRRRVAGASRIQSQRRPSTNTLRASAPRTVPPKPAPIMDSAQSYRWRPDMNARPARNRSPVSSSLKSMGSSSRCSRSALVALRSSMSSGEGVRPSGRLQSSEAAPMRSTGSMVVGMMCGWPPRSAVMLSPLTRADSNGFRP